jgi:hypothetical protein
VHTNNIVHTLLFQASIPPKYWVERLHIATYLLNRLPTKTIITSYPYTALYNTLPTYEHLWVFRCACYPNLSEKTPHKLAPDILYAVQQVCLHKHDLIELDMTALKHILRYLQGTLHFALHLHRSSTSDLVVYSDADWAGCSNTRESTSEYSLPWSQSHLLVLQAANHGL